MIRGEASFDLSGLERFMTEVVRQRVPRAAERALNDNAFAYRKRLQDVMRSNFDRPTPYTLRAFVVDKAGARAARQAESLRIMGQPAPAPSSRLEAHVRLSWDANKQGLEPFDTIGHQFTGGTPAFTGFERALRRIGVLPAGWHAVPGGGVRLNAYGNVSPGLIVQLISYFQAFGEQGYRANASERTRRRKAGKGTVQFTDLASRETRRVKTIAGVEYFISRGRGEVTGARGWKSGRMQHLPPGIYARTGIHGSTLRCIYKFVPSTRYRQRVDILAVAQDMDLSSRLGRDFLRYLR
ncbi:MAG: hypothetical protein GY848_05985 [Methyloversatilis sp.]|nr:hypothetical protein [Methyloversatilis sp.]